MVDNTVRKQDFSILILVALISRIVKKEKKRKERKAVKAKMGNYYISDF